jgi:hypothetical protein
LRSLIYNYVVLVTEEDVGVAQIEAALEEAVMLAVAAFRTAKATAQVSVLLEKNDDG